MNTSLKLLSKLQAKPVYTCLYHVQDSHFRRREHWLKSFAPPPARKYPKSAQRISASASGVTNYLLTQVKMTLQIRWQVCIPCVPPITPRFLRRWTGKKLMESLIPPNSPLLR